MNAGQTVVLYIIMTVFAAGFMRIADCRRDDRDNDFKLRMAHGSIVIPESRLFLMASFMILFFIAALRDNVGKDYLRYVELYEQIGLDELNANERKWMAGSIAYWGLNRLLYFFSANHYVLFAVTSFFTLLFFYKGIKERSNNWALSLYLFICFCLYYQCFNTVRQMLAIAIVFYAYSYLGENDWKRYFLYIFLASLFHLSALVCLPLWAVRKVRMNHRTVTAYIAAGIVFYFGFEFFMRLLSSTTYVSVYSSSGQYSFSYGLSTILNLGVRIIMFFFCLFFYKDTVEKYPKLIPVYHIAAICTVAQLGAIRFNLFGRVTTYFYTAYIMLLPAVFEMLERKFTVQSCKVVRAFIIAFFALYHFVYYFSSQGAVSGGYDLYRFIRL